MLLFYNTFNGFTFSSLCSVLVVLFLILLDLVLVFVLDVDLLLPFVVFFIVIVFIVVAIFVIVVVVIFLHIQGIQLDQNDIIEKALNSAPDNVDRNLLAIIVDLMNRLKQQQEINKKQKQLNQRILQRLDALEQKI